MFHRFHFVLRPCRFVVNDDVACRRNRSRETISLNYDYYVRRINHKCENRYRTDNLSSSRWYPHVVVVVSAAIKASSDVCTCAVQQCKIYDRSRLNHIHKRRICRIDRQNFILVLSSDIRDLISMRLHLRSERDISFRLVISLSH